MTAGKATEVVFDRPGELIELLRPVSVVAQLGARILNGLTGPVPFPKQTGPATAYWVQENPASDVPEGHPNLGSVTLSPKTLQAHVRYSRQILAQSSVGIEQMVRNELATVHGLAIDRAALHGPCRSNEPLGIYKSPDVSTEAMGGVPTYAKLVSMVGKVASDNAITPGARLAFATTPGMAAKLMTVLVASAAGSEMIWAGTVLDGNAANYPAAASNQLSSAISTLEAAGGTEHGIIFGNWNYLIVGLWGALELVVDPFTYARRGLISVTSFQMADIVVRHGESFCLATGATAS